MYMQQLQTNINSESLFKILLYKLCKRLHLANYDITTSPLPLFENTGYAEVDPQAEYFKVYGWLIKNYDCFSAKPYFFGCLMVTLKIRLAG